MGKKINFIVLAILVTISALTATSYPELTSEIDKGDTAWMLVSSAFVLLMTPGLSFFYGGDDKQEKRHFNDASKFCRTWRY